MEEISHTFVYNESVILKLNIQINNYFRNRGLEMNTDYSGEYNYIFTNLQLNKQLQLLKSYKVDVLKENNKNGISLINLMVNTNIPIFNRNRLRYMERDDSKSIEEEWKDNTIQYDKFALEHLQPMLFNSGITHVLFTWNLNCLFYKNDKLKNKPILYWYDSKNKKKWIQIDYPD